MRGLDARAVFGVLAVARAFSSARAEAAEPPGRVRLVWAAPAECPTEEAVLGEMQRILGGPPSRGASARADVQQEAPRRWSEHLSTEVDGVTGERTLAADSCDGLASATALILAWTIDPQRAASAGNPAAVPPDAPPPPPAADLSPHEPPSVAPVPTRPSPSPATTARAGSRVVLQAVVAMEAAFDLGTLPNADLGGRISAGALLGRLRLEVSFGDWLSQQATASPPRTTQGTTLHPLEGALRGCFRWTPVRRLEIDPCAGAGLTYVTSNGFGESVFFAGETAKGATWGSAYADALIVVAVAGPLALRGSVGLAIPLVRPEFDIQEEGNPSSVIFLHQASSVAGRAGLGVEVRFP